MVWKHNSTVHGLVFFFKILVLLLSHFSIGENEHDLRNLAKIKRFRR